MKTLFFGVILVGAILIGLTNTEYVQAYWNKTKKDIKNNSSIDVDIEEMKLYEDQMRTGRIDIKVARLEAKRTLKKLEREREHTEEQQGIAKEYMRQNIALLEDEEKMKQKGLSSEEVISRMEELESHLVVINENLKSLNQEIEGLEEYVVDLKQKEKKSNIVIANSETKRKIIERQNERLKALKKIYGAMGKFSAADDSSFSGVHERAQKKVDRQTIELQEMIEKVNGNKDGDLDKREYEEHPVEENYLDRMRKLAEG